MTPLSATSCHFPALHKCWPEAYIRSSAKLHSDPSLGFDVAKNFVVTRLAEAGASTAILDHLQTLPFMKPATSYTSVVGIWAHVDDIWLPVPMHPSVLPIRKAVAALNSCHDMQGHYYETFGRRFRLRIAWCRGGPKLSSIIDRMNVPEHSLVNSRASSV